MNRIPRAELCAALVITLSTSAAFAHVTLERREASPNESYRAVVQVNHGCSGQPTTQVRVTVPEGVIGAKPMPKPGWQVTTEKGPYARSYPYFHGDVAEGVKTITWSGGSLPDDQVDEFTFIARISDAFAPGKNVYFPVTQDCASGSLAWTEIPAEGQDSHSLKSPAPGVAIVAAKTAPPQTTGSAASAIKAGDLSIETPWMRATPAGATVAGGYVRITNTGKEPDRLIAASIPLAGSGSIHSMSMEGGVMRMAAVDGLAIKPGETIELKPGGYHLMFEALTGTPKVGEPVAGTLTFERAGKVPVTFAVAPIGAKAPDQAGAPPASGGHSHH